MTYLVQIDDVIRQATPDEVALIELRAAQIEAMQNEQLAKLEAKKSARNKLAALGLTDEEIQALVG